MRAVSWVVGEIWLPDGYLQNAFVLSYRPTSHFRHKFPRRTTRCIDLNIVIVIGRLTTSLPVHFFEILLQKHLCIFVPRPADRVSITVAYLAPANPANFHPYFFGTHRGGPYLAVHLLPRSSSDQLSYIFTRLDRSSILAPLVDLS